MTLRFLARICFFLVLAVALGAGAIRLWKNVPQERSSVAPDKQALQQHAEPSRGYVLTREGKALTFVLPPSAVTVRIQTNANLQAIARAIEERRQNPDRRWRYAISVEQLDKDGKVLDKRIHHFRRDLVERQLPDGQVGIGVFYLDQKLPQPLGTSSIRIKSPPTVRPAQIRVSLASADPDITDILVRIAVPEPLTQRDASTLWNRLSERQQQKLAAGNLYPPEILLEQERINLVESRFTELGPTGDAKRRDLQVLAGDERGAAIETPALAFPNVGPNRRITFQLPEEGARVRIEIEALARNARGEATVSWSGHSPFQRESVSLKFADGVALLERHFPGGWIEIGAASDATIKIIQIQPEQQLDVTPLPDYLRAWPASETAPLTYSISHKENLPTPLRLVIRRVETGNTLGKARVKVTFLDADGKALHDWTIDPVLQASLYDAVWPVDAQARLSDPHDVFFQVPAAVRKVRIESDPSVLVNAFTRPGDLPRAVRTPEDTLIPEAARESVPTWFPIQPNHHAQMMLDGRSQLLTVQRRPPEDQPELRAGKYQWEDFEPKQHGAARVFMAPRDPFIPQNADSARNIYRLLPESGKVTLLPDPVRGNPRPSLVWISPSPTRFDYSIQVDKRQAAGGVTSGGHGEIGLPQVSPGQHTITVSGAPPGKWLINYAKEGAPWIKRTAYRFERPLEFDIERTTTAKEFVAVRVFRPAGVASRMTVRVKVDPPERQQATGPMPFWLLSERIHDVRPSGEIALPMAESGAEKVDGGQPFFIPLPEGAPLGRYRISLTPVGSKAWISVSRLAVGATRKPTLIIEENYALDAAD